MSACTVPACRALSCRVYTHDNVRELLIERATDWDGFIARHAARLNESVAGHLS
ncbi:hypothetical protein [Lentzea aerocolonigenes]|uniref:hypothetical protein n=1 Tax=Lentzea aerocolonigenes TaxID=68170 RepID=UPI000A8FF944|nr:hypothetical protein [Lentzea aerocolonigenes]